MACASVKLILFNIDVLLMSVVQNSFEAEQVLKEKAKKIKNISS